MPSRTSPVLTEMQAYILGGWDLAICFTLFLQGVLCSQFAHYKDSTKRDSVEIKLFVAGLALLTTLKTSQCLAIMWMQNVTLFENVEGASTLWDTAWYSRLTMLLKTAVPFYVQMFFCYRLWASRISRNVYIAIICVMVFSFALICGVLGTFYIFTAEKPGFHLTSYWVETHMGVVVFGDLVLTGSIVFWLLRHNKAQSRQSAAPLTLCSLINFSVLLLRASAPDTPAFLMLHFITNNILPHLYAWSAMWTLNSRDDIVAAGNIRYTLNLGLASCASDVKTVTHQEDQVRSGMFNEA
ncbi:hypothetical protein C8R45DRAFT_1218414 [Mycena sanguinolenta]|nr:hypothetical protein C8R45DRAFT_1218414 [Mycena sanguinolenta]